MEKGFVCVVKAPSHSDNAFLRDFGGRFSTAEKYGTSQRAVLWCGDRPPFPYCLGAAAVGATSEYPVSTVTVDPSAPSVTVRADALGFKSPFVAAASGMVFLSDSVSLLREATAFFGVSISVDVSSVLAGLAYQSLPVGRTFLQGVSSQQWWTDATYGFVGDSVVTTSFERVRRVDFSKTEISEEAAWAQYRDAFDEAVERIVVATEGEKIGVLFSGGFDSSVVLNALVRHGKLRRGGILPITATNPRTPFSDDAYSVAVAREIGVERFETALSPDDVSLFSESVSAIGDSSDLWGFGILLKKAFREAARQGVRTVVSWSWTDAQVGSTRSVMSALWYLLYWPDCIEKSMSKQKAFVDPDGRISALMGRPVSDPSKFLSRLESFVYEATVRMPGPKVAPFLPDWAADAYFSNVPASFHDLAVLTDLLGNSHRASTLYAAMAKSEGVVHVSPFASSELRNRMFSYPVRHKFDPSRYPVTEWDNQFFYKNALGTFVPEVSAKRHKTVWSLSDHRLWLMEERNVGYFAGLLEDFSKRGMLPSEYCGKLLEEYLSPKDRTLYFDSHSETPHSFALWKIASAELALRSLGA